MFKEFYSGLITFFSVYSYFRSEKFIKFKSMFDNKLGLLNLP